MGSANWLRFPAPFPFDSFNPAVNTQNLPNQNDGVGVTMTAPATDTITHVGYRQGTTTGTPAVNSYRIGIQSLNTSGLPSGTYLASGNASATFQPAAANDGTWQWISLGANTVSATIGDQFALTLMRDAATDASNKITAGKSWDAGGATPRAGWEVFVTAAAGTWSKGSVGYPMMGMKSASTVYGWPLSGTFPSNIAFGGTTEVGMLFTVPSNWCSTYQVAGWRAVILTPSAAKTFVGSLYTINGSRVPQAPPTQATGSLDSDAFTNTSALRIVQGYFTSTPTLTAGTQYAFGLATTTASDANLYYVVQAAAGDFDAYQGQQQTSLTSRTVAAYPPAGDTTAFAAGTTTQRPMIELIFADLTAPAGGTTRGIIYGS